MKYKIYAITFLAILFMASRSKEDEVAPTDDKKADVEVYMSANTAGQKWTAASVTSSKNESGTVSILGEDEDGNTVTISFTKDINAPGKYEYAFSTASGTKAYSAFRDSGSNTIYGSYSGTLEITEYDTDNGVIKGTFEFIGMSVGGSQVRIEGGDFQIAY